MGAPKKATHEIVHPSLYMSVGGQLQEMKVGAQITLTDEQAERLGKKVKVIGDAATIVIGAGGTETVVTADQFYEAVKQLDTENKDHFTDKGIPELRVLKALGIDVKAAQRDELWAAYQAG